MTDMGHLSLYNQYRMIDGSEIEEVMAEYVWIDGRGDLRAKCRTLTGLDPDQEIKLSDLPEWNYDGSSCYQATTENSEVIMKPVAMYKDPFRGPTKNPKHHHLLVLCDTYRWEDSTCQKLTPSNTNFRVHAEKIFEAAEAEEPWFGIEQEYTMIGTSTKFTTWPLGWPNNGYPGAQGPYYCSVGANKCFGRVISDAHYRACLYAGIQVSGTNGEVMPGQWEYQVGPVQGISIGDQLYMSRYILGRVAEDYNVDISFAPKLFPDWNGSGCHTNYSTKTMRAGTEGMPYIDAMCAKLDEKHKLHLSCYGTGNESRLTGKHETSSMDKFSYGVGNRAASVRIPTSTNHANGKGYIEDRRPASNIDGYVVGALLVDTTVLEESLAEPLVESYQAWIKEVEESEE